jgi:hypothetical protein
MVLLHKLSPLVLCFTLTFLLPSVGSAQDDYDREGRRSSTRMSERDQRSFERFLDSHDETAQELYRDPDLVKSERFLEGHSALRNWLEDHPDAAEALRDDPRAIIWRERTTTGREREEREERRPTTARISERDLESFNAYLDSHDETADLLYQNPELIKDRQFVRDHDALNDWLRDHPDAAEAIRANPHVFLRRERSSTPQDVIRQLLK